MEELLAKIDGETLLEHTRKVINNTRIIVSNLPLNVFLDTIDKDTLLNLVTTCALFHDTGKAAVGFQKVLKKEKANWGGKRHEVVSAILMSSYKDILPEQILAVLTHHKDIPSDGVSDSYKALNFEFVTSDSAVYQEMINEWKQNKEMFQYFWNKMVVFLNGKYSEIKNISDLGIDERWLDRSSGRYSQIKNISYSERRLASLLRGLLITADHLASGGIKPVSIPILEKYKINNYPPRDFQSRISKLKGQTILRAPTGSGKTEAALLWAANNQVPNGRVFYVLPHTASINAMHKRLCKIFGMENVGILHSKIISYLYDLSMQQSENPQQAQEYAKNMASLCREAYYPIKICTAHQILRCILRGRGWEQIFFEYPGACFIFDEIHAYDPVITGLIIGTAKLLNKWGAKYLFVSATMPSFLRKLLSNHLGDIHTIEPNIDNDEDRKIMDKKRHNLIMKDNGNMLDFVDWIISECEKNSSNLIVCNHVASAQELFRQISPSFNENEVQLLHSRFNREDRNRIENGIIEKSLPKILIATQVVEVSLDIDFERGFFEPAPIDAIVQRMGRVNREGKFGRIADITMFREQIGKYSIYSNEKISLTIEEMEKLSMPVSEFDIIKAADNVYKDGYNKEEDQEFKNALHHPDLVDFENRMIAGCHRNWIEDTIEQSDKTIEVLPSKKMEAYEKRRNNGLWIEADNLLVPIRARSIYKFGSLLNLKEDPPKIYIEYSELGLTDDPVNNMI
ncbi:MAG: CRISPR-associated helicase Cas3' [Candidatus Brocadiaceae bacterium]|nr:CRISPR-associated helicase Cas3' [Candidatus Brocadiaceae bacterium]